MYGGFADAELLGGGTHRGTVLYDVKRQPAGAFLDVPFQTATLPALILTGDVYAPAGPDMWLNPWGRRVLGRTFAKLTWDNVETRGNMIK